jgi:hypothetical protein
MCGRASYLPSAGPSDQGDEIMTLVGKCKTAPAFCGARGKGVDMPRQTTEFERQMAIYESLRDEIDDAMDHAQHAADRARASAYGLTKLTSSQDLQKVAGLVAKADEEIAKVESLQRRAGRALERARAARDDHMSAAWRCQPAPTPRGTFASAFNGETDIEKTLSAGVLARRFSPEGN